MKIQRMLHGEVVKETTLPSRFYKDTRWDLVRDRYLRRVLRLFDRRGDFVESISNANSISLIRNCGDNCLRVIDDQRTDAPRSGDQRGVIPEYSA